MSVRQIDDRGARDPIRRGEEGIPLDSAALDADEPQRGEPRDGRRGDVLVGEIAQRQAVGRAAQERDRLLLALPELRLLFAAAQHVESLRREHGDAHGTGRVGGPLERTGQRDQAVGLEARDDRLHRLGFPREGRD